ncbi:MULTISPECIES: arsenic resistance N-acetyltransferase ArsN2 [unclassified Methylophaga]|jgi:amino-acid N-acetyltransferase|uniref:arsenic resistance N-acetyltransferase ArsN2 n=1 Tax=unclassified Methylophaga TaxID=2629249 RepID=UPI000C98AC3A|nr:MULTISPECIES: arsenic resistance N-acetyltransferase ArsN2 [unclassified Methylophaga]MAK67829.1 GNAT family N-acetyltransferase [Methylophaga sp.]MAY18510.1 GNAT family N-acetyltransferase [Methylophaga sp.]HAO23709.1 GNAT family N-acetyltransferase [Methylophaga sp.]HCD05011.1 GNAT family N-acetyltransferase [Methylophaga sp.]|tara:strand:- start:5204 stop:5674 length:471 start_codon:yes stop_codon:yes gene_type:complete
MNIEPIELNDEIETLLVGEELPISDLHSSNQTQFFRGCEGVHIIGVVGIEIYENVGLLRSLVVEKGCRKAGYGKQLAAKAETWAYEGSIKSLYLLTTTAAGFFSQLGYQVIPRTQAPVSIANTAQFVGLCPSSATFMYKELNANNLIQPTVNVSVD